ncbi:MAG: VWA domain-containing protein [Dehalococcoidia bacterium]|nr:VWA domain-containing protein [Dehalococcoidia bacterium]
MRFADPYLLALLALIPLLLFLKGRLVRESGTGGYSNLALLAGSRPTWRLRYRWLPTMVRVGALALLILALARPQTGQAESELPGQGIDIALVFDTSSSMSSFSLGDDTRLAVAQRVLDDFIAGRQEDRLGLVIFRSDGLVLSPLTLDYDALRALVADVEQVNLSDGTAIGTGLAEGLNLLRESRARSRVAILATDGENNSGEIEPLEAARIAETLGIRVYTIGILETGGRANVDERALQEMAQLTGGRYFPAESEAALAAIYENIDELETSRVGRVQFGAYNEVAIYFLAGALLLLAMELGLRSTVWRQAT